MSSSDIKLDLTRAERIGFDEAILCAGKSAEQLVRIIEEASEKAMSLLLTRLDADIFASLPARFRDRVDYDSVSRTGLFDHYPDVERPRNVGVITAGTSDVPIAREA